MSNDISYLSLALKDYVCNLYVYREIRREVKESYKGGKCVSFSIAPSRN